MGRAIVYEEIRNLGVGRRFDFDRSETCIEAIGERLHVAVTGGDDCGLRREIVERSEVTKAYELNEEQTT